jgi:hypothetical protein
MLPYRGLREVKALGYLGIEEFLAPVAQDLPLPGGEDGEVGGLLFGQQVLQQVPRRNELVLDSHRDGARDLVSGIISTWTNPEAPVRRASRASGKSKCDPKIRMGCVSGLNLRWPSNRSERSHARPSELTACPLPFEL